jgi:hypothetical protein
MKPYLAILFPAAHAVVRRSSRAPALLAVGAMKPYPAILFPAAREALRRH